MSAVLADSVFVLRAKYSKAKYAPSAKAWEYGDQIRSRFIKPAGNQGTITFIASNPVMLLAIIPDYVEYRILKMYAYSDKMVACDVLYTLSKKQERDVRMGVTQTLAKLTPDLAFTDMTAEDIVNLDRCQAGGYVFAQTYQTSSDDGEVPAMIPPFGIDWKENRTPENQGVYSFDNNRVVQTWRAVFTHVSATKQIRDANKLKFALDMGSSLASDFGFIDRLHVTQTHPDWVYSSTGDFGGQSEPPLGYYWEENVTYALDHRSSIHGNQWTYWRRPKERKIADVEGVWLEPSVAVSLLSPKQFGQTFGTFLPDNMAGVDFSVGPIASIDWFGKLTYKVRSRNGEISQERIWSADTHIPLRKDLILEAIKNFKEEATETPKE